MHSGVHMATTVLPRTSITKLISLVAARSGRCGLQQPLVFGKQVRVLEHHPDPACVVKPLPLSELLLWLRAAADGEARHAEDLVAEGLGEEGIAGVPRVGRQQLQNRI